MKPSEVLESQHGPSRFIVASSPHLSGANPSYKLLSALALLVASMRQTRKAATSAGAPPWAHGHSLAATESRPPSSLRLGVVESLIASQRDYLNNLATLETVFLVRRPTHIGGLTGRSRRSISLIDRSSSPPLPRTSRSYARSTCASSRRSCSARGSRRRTAPSPRRSRKTYTHTHTHIYMHTSHTILCGQCAASDTPASCGRC